MTIPALHVFSSCEPIKIPVSSEVRHDVPRRSIYDCCINELSASVCLKYPNIWCMLGYLRERGAKYVMKAKKVANIRNRYNQVPHLTQDNTCESDINTIKQSQTRAKRSNLSQQVTTRQQWTDAKACQTQDINNTNDPLKKYRLGTVSKNILLEGLNRFHAANLTLSSDVHQDT